MPGTSGGRLDVAHPMADVTLRSDVRADKGLKRGPRNRKLRALSPKADLGTWQIPADLNPDEVLERYLTEATTSQIAGQYGLSRKALTKWLREQRPKEWKQAQIIRALAMKESAEEGMMDACDALSLARTRELVKAAQFDLTALDPDYQPKTEIAVQVNHNHEISIALESSINDLLLKIREPNQVIDVQPQQSEDKT